MYIVNYIPVTILFKLYFRIADLYSLVIILTNPSEPTICITFQIIFSTVALSFCSK